MRFRSYNKYHNQHTYIDGFHFASKREGIRYKDLKLLEKTGEIKDLVLQPHFDFPMGFYYKADFMYTQNGKQIVEDVKGYKTDMFILKEKCFHYFYPTLKLILVK